MIQIWKSDTPAQRILEWVCWFCRGDQQLRDQEGRAMDIVVRLRANYSEFDSSGVAHMALEAADEIERLRVELAAMAMDRNAHMERAERAVAELAAERERCAKVCDAVADKQGSKHAAGACRECAAAIRKGE